MRIATCVAALAILAGCGRGTDEAANGANQAAAPNGPSSAPKPEGAPAWSLQASAGGSALTLRSPAGEQIIGLRCHAHSRDLGVDVPAFRTIGSEDRLSFGSGGEVVALAAAIKEHGQSGVSAHGALPANLAALIGGPISARYGAQESGPHPAPPAELARAFTAACGGAAAEEEAPDWPAPAPSGGAPGACMKQAEEVLNLAPLRAVGTEPFWGARIEGRCVTYNHPEDQKGIRIWTRYTAGPDGGIWTGALGGKKFELRTRSKPSCSDGMSDRKYEFAVELLVGGEKRTGCAEPI